MIKTYENCLVYEPDQQEKIEWEILERIQLHKIPGILSVSCIKKDMQDALIFFREGLVPIREIVTGLSQKQVVTCILRIIDILQKIRDEQNMYLHQIVLGQEYIFMDPVSDMVYLLYLPIQKNVEVENRNWESSLRLIIAELMRHNGMDTTAIGKSISVLTRGRIVAPENLGRNIQIVAKKMLHQFEYCREFPEAVSCGDNHKESREEFEKILGMFSDNMAADADEEIAAALETEELEEGIALPEPEMEEIPENYGTEIEEMMKLPDPEEHVRASDAEYEEIMELMNLAREENLDISDTEDEESMDLPEPEPEPKEESSPAVFEKPKESAYTEELSWEERMKRSASPWESQTQGVVVGRKRAAAETAEAAEPVVNREAPRQSDSVVSGKLKKQSELEGRQDGTQVLRKNIWQPEAKAGGTGGGFMSVNPLRLNEQGTGSSGASPAGKNGAEKQLHFVSFGVGAPRVDLIVDKTYFVIGKLASGVDGVISYTSTISRMHCAIHKTDTDVYIEDLGSANHTFVNDKELIPYEREKIGPKDVIRLANESFSIQYK